MECICQVAPWWMDSCLALGRWMRTRRKHSLAGAGSLSKRVERRGCRCNYSTCGEGRRGLDHPRTCFLFPIMHYGDRILSCRSETVHETQRTKATQCCLVQTRRAAKLDFQRTLIMTMKKATKFGSSWWPNVCVRVNSRPQWFSSSFLFFFLSQGCSKKSSSEHLRP